MAIEVLYLAGGVVLLFVMPGIAFASIFAILVLIGLLGSEGSDWVAN
ncbi:hypothetical protein AB0M64_18575 [Streptomyces sp. NPDC051771]